MSESVKKVVRLMKGEVDDVDRKRKTVTSIVTSEGIDRYGEVILMKGIKLDNYRNNPVVLWGHDQDRPIGKNVSIARKVKDGCQVIIAKTLFHKGDFAQEIFELYADEFLNGWSIAGNTTDWKLCGPPDPEEIKARPELKKCRYVWRNLDLYEYSAVSIPANPDALGNEVGKKISADLRRQIEQGERWEPRVEASTERPDPAKDPESESTPALTLPPLVGRTFEQAIRDIRRQANILTGPEAAERAAKDTIDRAMGRV